MTLPPVCDALEGLGGLLPSVCCLAFGLAWRLDLEAEQVALCALIQGCLWLAAETIWLKRRAMHFSALHLLAMMLREAAIPVLALHALVGQEIRWRGQIQGGPEAMPRRQGGRG
jgi:hypothetical protein